MIDTAAGELRDAPPFAYQEIDGRRVEIEASHDLDPSAPGEPRSLGFRLGAYDASLPLVIDPKMLIYCGYIGGEDDDFARSVAVDEQGTEAAAASGVVIKKRGLPTTFRADRPFLFLIQDRETGLVLFLGRVTDPSVGAQE